MNNSHIAIINLPNSVAINPTLSTVSTLIRRGYRVTYVTSEPFSSKISTLGAEVLLCPRFEFPFNQTNESDSLPLHKQYVTSVIDLASSSLSYLTEFYENNRPTAVLYYSYAFAGLILAQRFGVPAIKITSHSIFDDKSISNPVVSTSYREKLRRDHAMYDDFLHDYGVRRANPLATRDEPTIYFYLKDLQLSQHEVDRNSLYAARCAGEMPFSDTWRSKCRDDRYMILVSASTSNDEGLGYYRLCVDAISGLGWHMILAIGSNNDAKFFDHFAPHCEIVQHIPRSAVTPHVDFQICHGGMVTVMESMYCGVPMIMLSQGHPQIELEAQNIHNHRLGMHLKRSEANIHSLRECAIEISRNTAIHEKVKQTQRIVKQSPGGEEVVNWIEQYLENRR